MYCSPWQHKQDLRKMTQIHLRAFDAQGQPAGPEIVLNQSDDHEGKKSLASKISKVLSKTIAPKPSFPRPPRIPNRRATKKQVESMASGSAKTLGGGALLIFAPTTSATTTTNDEDETRDGPEETQPPSLYRPFLLTPTRSCASLVTMETGEIEAEAGRIRNLSWSRGWYTFDEEDSRYY